MPPRVLYLNPQPPASSSDSPSNPRFGIGKATVSSSTLDILQDRGVRGVGFGEDILMILEGPEL